MREIDRFISTTSVSYFRPRRLMFAVVGAVLVCSVSTSIAATAQGPATQAATLSARMTEEIILRAPGVVRRPLPRSGPNTPPGLIDPEIISLTRAVNYSDLDLSNPAGMAALQTRIRNTARDICQELTRRFPRTQYVYVDPDCVRKATDDGIETVRAITFAAKSRSGKSG